MSMTTNKQTLCEAAEKAAGAHERLSIMPEGDIFDISLVEGTQLDEDITALNAFNDAANPATVLALLDELEAAERRNAELMEKLAKLIDILDWHTIELGWGEKPITLAELIVAREGADSLSSFRAAATDKGE